MRLTALGILIFLGSASQVIAETVTVKIDQITDLSATAATGMFRFVPDLVRIQPGDGVTFLNSHRQHTVHSVRGFWPEDVPVVAIANKPEVEVRFDKAGLYALRCLRHGRYGMVLLIIVGKPGFEKAEAAVRSTRLISREKAALLKLIERARKEP